MDSLTNKQREFLKVRPSVDSDAEAARQVSVSPRTIRNWKVGAAFEIAYATVMDLPEPELSWDEGEEESPVEFNLPAPVDVEVSTPEEVREIVAEQLRDYSVYMPTAFRRLIDIIINGKDHHSLKALEMYFKLYEVSPGMMRAEELPAIHQQILNWTQINVGKQDDDEDNRTGAPEIEGTFREVSSEQQPSDSERPDGVSEAHD